VHYILVNHAIKHTLKDPLLFIFKILASLFDHKSIVSLLINKGANINDINKYGQTALYWGNDNHSLDLYNLIDLFV
jgi:hypothetical protein